MSTLITNIAELMTQDLEHRVLKDAAVVIDGERIEWIGDATSAPAADEAVDAGGRALLPGWVDSHTHLVFAGDRTAEFEARMAGEAYSAGGIAVTMEATRGTSDFDLTRLAMGRVAEAVSQGSTYFETKTGYGLDPEHEARSARVASTVADEATYLGAHLVPAGIEADEYTKLVCGPMLDAVRPYVRWADVFCEEGAFTQAQSREVLRACREAGLGLRVHGNQLGEGPGHCSHVPSRVRSFHPAATRPRAAAPGCGSAAGPGLQLQPGNVVHQLHGVLCGHRRTPDEADCP
jgi:imidazolonepropionase